MAPVLCLIICIFNSISFTFGSNNDNIELHSIIEQQQSQIDNLKTLLIEQNMQIRDLSRKVELLDKRCEEKENSRNERLLVGSMDTEMKVGFYARIKGKEAFGQHKLIVFNDLVTNYGGGYSNHSGIFTAPVHGLYGFSCALVPSSKSYGSLLLLKNEEIVAEMFTDTNMSDWDAKSSSTTVILYLNQGDDVFVRSREANKFHNLGSLEGSLYGTSSFVGWLIAE